VNILLDLETEFNLKPIQMANKLKLSKIYYSMMRNGKRILSKNVALKLKEQFGITLEKSLGSNVRVKQT